MKTLNQAELLSIARLKQKGTPLLDIADRIGITLYELKMVLNWIKKTCK